MILLLSAAPSKKLAHQLIAVILSAYLVFALATTILQMVLEFGNEKNTLNEQISSLAITFQPSVSEALWNYDDDQLNAALAGLYRNDEVVGVLVDGGEDRQYRIGLVEDESGHRVFSGEESKTKERVWEGIYDVLYMERFELLAPSEEREYLGELRLYFSSATVIERTYATFLLTLLSALIKTLALWFIATWVVNRLVAKPITQLASTMQDFDVEGIKAAVPPRSQSRNNELAVLEEAFASLCHTLAERNIEVREHQNNLEAQIEERTRHLEQAYQEMVRLNQAKSDFLANMSHELRTPLNSIIGFTKKLHRNKDDALAESTVDILSVVLRNGEHLLSLINNVLDMSKIEAGRMEIDRENCALDREVGQISKGLQPLAEDRGLTINVHAEDVPEVLVDPLRFRQVVNNLLGNAIKFSAAGVIDISVRRSERDGKDGVSVSIKDCGIGISEEDLPKLFSQFQQLGASGANATPGTGLGLALSKQLVELHKGKIEVESTVGEGSTFTVWLPYA